MLMPGHTVYWRRRTISTEHKKACVSPCQQGNSTHDVQERYFIRL